VSFFFAGYQASLSDSENLRNCFIEIVPEAQKRYFQFIQDVNSFLFVYGTNKTIRDVFYQDEKSDSWIAILGTPLIDLDKIKQEKASLSTFFSNPGTFINNYLDGCWCILAYDSLNDLFYACTDYNNSVPVYYSIEAGGIYFSSHELPLARFLQSEIDPMGFSMTIQLKLTWGAFTRFKSIKKLLPCQIVTFNKNKEISFTQYWSPIKETLWEENLDRVIEHWLTILKTSIGAYHSASENKTVLCDITGGEDSRLILSTVHNLGIPFIAVVEGEEADPDVIIAKKLAVQGNFQIDIRRKPSLAEDILLNKAAEICLFQEGYEDFFESCKAYLLNLEWPITNYDHIKFAGAPGGEVFRGSYYLRGKALMPSASKNLDYIFFTKMKFMLDFYPNLFQVPDKEFKDLILSMTRTAIREVRNFPIGIQIDHLLHIFQTCNTGLIYKHPRYLPFASKELTKSIYKIPPKFKQGGKLTRACTEILFPEISQVKTQKGAPTIRKDFLNFHRFIPEYISLAKSISSGVSSRLLKLKDSNKPGYNWERNYKFIRAILTNPPYSNWFNSGLNMITGYLYENKSLNELLIHARQQTTKFVPTLMRIISQELICRWVYKEF